MNAMFVEGLDKNLHINDPSQLNFGDELWHVGQGGVCDVQKPRFMGYFERIEDGKIFYCEHEVGELYSTSLKDHHILPNTYNNWYICKTEQDANDVYTYIKNEWDSNPAYDLARTAYEIRCNELDEMFNDIFSYR